MTTRQHRCLSLWKYVWRREEIQNPNLPNMSDHVSPPLTILNIATGETSLLERLVMLKSSKNDYYRYYQMYGMVFLDA